MHTLAPNLCNREMIITKFHNILKIPIKKSTVDLTLKTTRQPASNNNNQEVSYAPLCITVPCHQKVEVAKKSL